MASKSLKPFPQLTLPAYERKKILQRLAGLIEKEQSQLARLICSEVKKPISLAQNEVRRAVAVCQDAAEESVRQHGEWLQADVQQHTLRHQIFSKKLPRGPLLAITPFNYPFNLPMHKIAPAMALGMPFALKPSPRAVQTGQALVNLVHRAGWPAAAAQVLQCSNQDVMRWVWDARFAVVSFTGSADIGWRIKAEAGKKQVLLELGGNASVILAPDALWQSALPRLAWGAFMYAGQVCIAVQQIWVHESFYDSFIKALKKETLRLGVGDPRRAKTLVPPLIDAAAADRVMAWIGQATAQGAKLLCGGKRQGALVYPTVLTQVPEQLPLVCEEAFGPVLIVHRYRNLPEVYACVNQFRYGLQASIYTRSQATAFEAFESLRMGTVLVNEIPTFRLDTMPYGGTKDSGFGREGVRFAMEHYSEPRNLVLLPAA